VSFPRDLAIKPMLCDAWDPQSGKYGPVHDEHTHSYGMFAARVTLVTVPTGQTDSEGNEPLRAEDNRALFDAIINDDPAAG
jgi:hypothetical protein